MRARWEEELAMAVGNVYVRRNGDVVHAKRHFPEPRVTDLAGRYLSLPVVRDRECSRHAWHRIWNVELEQVRGL